MVLNVVEYKHDVNTFAARQDHDVKMPSEPFHCKPQINALRPRDAYMRQ